MMVDHLVASGESILALAWCCVLPVHLSGWHQGCRVAGIGLVTTHVGANVLGHQAHLDAQAIEPACPVVSRATDLHDHRGHGSVGKPALELGAGQALGFNDAPVLVGDGDLKNRFDQVSGHGSSMHIEIPSFFEDLIPTPMKTSAPISCKQTGKSIPSIERTLQGLRPWAASHFKR